jgi:predicted enzyme related to lactoylglutathione lyase
MRLTRDRNVGWPALQAASVSTAAGFYRDVLGFEQIALLGGVPPRLAIFRWHGATMLLQEGSGAGRGPRGQAGPPWDAVLTVRDVDAAHRELAARGCTGLSDVSAAVGWRFFEFQDPDGNAICVGQSSENFLRRLSTPPSPLLAGIRARRQDARAAREEREHLQQFQEFYRGLANKRDAFYMFFTSGLLHWVKRAEAFVPRDVNLVLIGSGLTDDEREWLGANIDRPFHNIRMPVDDITVWDFLFATNEHNFGWLDIDCFVLNSELFGEMADLAPDHSMNCTWASDPGFGFPVGTTHFLFVNVEAIKAIGAMGARKTASTFDWSGSSRLFAKRECFSKVLTATERKLLLKVLPPDAKGRPQMLYGSFYETFVVFQLLARVAGFQLNQVRSLVRQCRTPYDELGEASADPRLWPEELSDELYHLSAISHYQNYEYGGFVPALYLAAELVMLQDIADELPAYYAEHRDKLAARLADTGRPPETASELFRQHLVAARGLSEAAADRVLGRTPVAVEP